MLTPEQAARTVKVQKLMPVLQQLAAEIDQIASVLARRMDGKQRALACRIAQVNDASDVTWAKLVSALELAEKPTTTDELFKGLS
jgi:hypothetical protein